MTLQYHLKNYTARQNTDLTDFTNTIVYSVQKVFPDAEVSIFPKFFEIRGNQSDLSCKAKLQNMGRKISYYCASLREGVTTYGDARQLFIRKPSGGRMR